MQAKKLAKAYQDGKGITIRMSSRQLKHNTKIEGGFLGLLAGLAARALPMIAKTVLPALGVGALSGLASSGVQKAMGSGLYLKKGGLVKACLHIHDFWLRCRYDSPRFVKSSCTVVIRSRTVVNRGES